MISAKRRRETARIIKKRLKLVKIYDKGSIDLAKKQPNRLAKRPPFGCKRSHCQICHHDKWRRKKDV